MINNDMIDFSKIRYKNGLIESLLPDINGILNRVKDGRELLQVNDKWYLMFPNDMDEMRDSISNFKPQTSNYEEVEIIL